MAVNAKNWQELKKPSALERKSGDGKRRATFVAEPLERGFGLTLGNALRRVLLSSLQGAAVTSIKIENVLHEFSSLAGVREDVTDIVLNVKQIAIRMQGEGPKRLQLSATGPADVKAGDIAVSGDIEIMNKDLLICHLDEGATLNMELTADVGKGYVPAAANRPADAPIGLNGVDTYPALLAELMKRGWSDTDIAKLAGGNVLRALEGAEKVAASMKGTAPTTGTIATLDAPAK